MTFRKLLSKSDTGGPRDSESSQKDKVYGYVDAFKKMGDQRPIQMFPVTLKKITIGRDHSCQIRINNSRVSRYQCAVLVSDDVNNLKINLQNLTARATTVHNNKVILGLGDQVVLQHGDRFRIFDVEFRWRKYDPVDEQGQLDWTRPIPIIRLASPTRQPSSNPSQVGQRPQESSQIQPSRKQLAPLPILKVSNRSLQEQRRKSCPSTLSLSSSLLLAQQNSNRPKISKWSTMRLLYTSLSTTTTPTPPDNKKRNNKQLQQQQQQQQNMNNKNLSPPVVGDKRTRSITGGNVSSKRRGSADYDMRKAVLQRSFRRAFKDKLQQGSLIDVHDTRFRRALEDLIVLSSAA